MGQDDKDALEALGGGGVASGDLKLRIDLPEESLSSLEFATGAGNGTGDYPDDDGNAAGDGSEGWADEDHIVTGGDEEGMTIEDADEAAAAATKVQASIRGRQARAALAKQTGGNSAEAGGGESQPEEPSSAADEDDGGVAGEMAQNEEHAQKDEEQDERRHRRESRRWVSRRRYGRRRRMTIDPRRSSLTGLVWQRRTIQPAPRSRSTSD